MLSMATAYLLASPALLGQSTTRVNVDSAGVQANDKCWVGAISGNGRYVGFYTGADNLVPGDTNQNNDVFVHDRTTGQTTRVSVDSSGAQGDGNSFDPFFSADGRYVGFSSNSTNLVPGDTNLSYDTFVHDQLTLETTRVSLTSLGQEASSHCYGSGISDDGRFVSFTGFASNLVPGDINGIFDGFVHDRLTGSTELVSVSSSGAHGDLGSSAGGVSSNGRYVAIEGEATTLVPGDTNASFDVFVHDRLTGLMERVSVDSAGVQANHDSFSATTSADGRHVAFTSHASNLVAGDTNTVVDDFVHDRNTGLTERVSVDSAGNQANGGSFHCAISGDGRYVVIESTATNLVPGDTNGQQDIFLRDRATGVTERVSVDTLGVQANGVSERPWVSSSGRYVAFQSLATNLVAGDTNGEQDIFVRDRGGCTSTVSTYCTASTTSIGGCAATISSIGTASVAFPVWFTISSGNLPGGNVGIAYFGVSGPDAAPFGTQGGFLCAAAPLFRSISTLGGGAPGVCNGSFSFTLQDLISQHAGVVTAGATVHTGLWFRDPPSPDGFGLSNGLSFTVCP